MTSNPDKSLVYFDQFPRSSTYDPEWVLANQMGPNVLWLTEFLCEKMALRPGMRVLDLGCGKALSSIFLAREFDVQVWATDLWIPATDNSLRIREAALDDRVFPLHCDARDLPFADGFFDAIISVDAFEYFGTEANFLSTLIRMLKMGGEIGVANAGVIREVDLMPDDWPDDFSSFHSPEWWRQLWSISRLVEVTAAENLPNGHDVWVRWNRAVGETGDAYLTSPTGENLTLHRLVARRIR